MSDDDDDDLFGGDDGNDSDDTAELLSASRKAASTSKPAATKKKVAAAKPDSDDDGKGLFDSDSEDDEDETPKKKKAAAAAVPKKKTLSKREKLQALAKKRHGGGGGDSKEDAKPRARSNNNKSATAEKPKEDGGYDSGDSYNSATFQRTKEDDDFLDTTGEDAEDVQELYREQHFDDERGEAEEEGGKKKKGSSKKRRHHDDDEAMEDNGEPDNPIMAAVHRMKKKKRERKNLTQLEDEAKAFLGKMEAAADQDQVAVREKRPATKKLQMLQETMDMLTRRDMHRVLLDFDLLAVAKRWIQPLPNGQLANVTVRQKLLTAISKMTGESGVTNQDLRRSELGKTVMLLYKHKQETPAMKRLLKELVEQWSRPIFQKSGNMRDLERVHANRGAQGLAALAHQQRAAATAANSTKPVSVKQQQEDLDELISSGRTGAASEGLNRVRVPFSKGFSFSVRPVGKDAQPSPEKRSATGDANSRDKLKKRMLEKGRVVSKNQRSANISVEGRKVK